MRSIPRPASWPDRLSAFRGENCDALVSVYFPCVIPSDVLEIFGRRAVNLHPAPLPLYRGPTPIHAMALDESIVTDGAMSLHVMSPQLDQGPIIAREPIPFPADASFVRYLLNAARAAGRLTQHTLPTYLDGQLAAARQDESKATYLRVTEDDMAISSALCARQVELRCLLFARRRALRVKGCPGARVSGFLRELGPPTGAQPRPYYTAIEIDVIDRRVLLRRRMPWSSLRGKCQDWLAYLTVRG
jgi:hypothetical protein